MPSDRYSALWVSHTSINDFRECPRAYYLRNVYRDPKNGHKIKLMTPPLALGQAVHEVLNALSVLPARERFHESLMDRLDRAWEKLSGTKGGFANADIEFSYKERARSMLRRVYQNPGPLGSLAVKIQTDLPHYWLSEEDNIILCGKLDWLEYLPDSDNVHIIDFKTSKSDEDPQSLQLPIYYLLARNCQKREVTKTSYWYLERSDTPQEIPLPDHKEAHQKVFEKAKQMKLARQLERFRCSKGDGCWACQPLEEVLNGKADFVGVNEYNQDVYILDKYPAEESQESIIL